MVERNDIHLTRRGMLQTIIAAGTAPVFVANRLLGDQSPSNTLRLAQIGTGRMGRGDMQNALYKGFSEGARIVAVCDVDSDRTKAAKNRVERIYEKRLGEGQFEPVKRYGDYRELLERENLDGVVISTPDHWHALPAIAAANAGVGVYLQKPLTHTIPEGRALVKAVQANDVAFQTGSQQRSSLYFQRVVELVRNGRIGNVKSVEVTLPKDHGTGDPATSQPPKSLDYDFWLGPRQKAPYAEDRVHPAKGFGRPGWLQIEQYSLGMITGWGAHMFDIAQWGLGCDQDGAPTTIQATGQFPDRGLFDVHTSFEGQATYPNGVKLYSKSGRPAGVKFVGEDGWLFVRRGEFKASDQALLREELGDNATPVYKSKHHMTDFLKALREGGRTAAPVNVGHRSNSVCVLHHIAMKLGRPLKWDPKRERFIDDAQANAMLDYEHREPWTV
jgi:predicted dehydrogenase